MGDHVRSLPNCPGNDRDRKTLHANPLGDCWRVGTLQGGQKYLYRATNDPENPEIKFVEYAGAGEVQAACKASDEKRYDENEDLTKLPKEQWKLGMLSSGDKYLWRETGNLDDLEIRLVRPPDSKAEHVVKDEWKLDQLPCGEAFLWRLSENLEDPEIRLQNVPDLDSGEQSSKDVSEEEMKRSIYEFRKHHLGPDHAQTLKAMNDFNAAFLRAGHQAKTKMVREAYDISSKVLGPQHPETIKALDNYAAQESFQKRVLELSSSFLGSEHPETLKALNSYAVTVAILGRTEEALPLNQRVLELTRRVHVPWHPSLLSALRNYAVTLRKLGRDSEAEPIQKELLQCTRRYFRSEHIYMLRALNSYAATLSTLGRHAEAEAPNKEVYKIMHKEFGRAHPLTLVALRNYAVTVSALGREAEAEPLRRKAKALTRFWGRWKGFGIISKELGPLCHMEAHDFFKQIKQQQSIMEFDNPYA